QKHLNRPALLLANGSVYIGFGSHADADPYHGWLFAYDPATLQKKAVLNLSPDAGEAAIWQSGVGPAADSDGFIYLSTGNGEFTVPSGKKSYGNSVVKLSPDLRVVDFFTPCNQCHMAVSDSDLGSGGVLVVPDQPGPFPRLALACGKEGTIYVLDRDDLGK